MVTAASYGGKARTLFVPVNAVCPASPCITALLYYSTALLYCCMILLTSTVMIVPTDIRRTFSFPQIAMISTSKASSLPTGSIVTTFTRGCYGGYSFVSAERRYVVTWHGTLPPAWQLLLLTVWCPIIRFSVTWYTMTSASRLYTRQLFTLYDRTDRRSPFEKVAHAVLVTNCQRYNLYLKWNHLDPATSI